MRTTPGFGNAGQKVSALFLQARHFAPAIGGHLYTALIFAVAIGFLWLAATLSSAQTLAQLRPTLQTALAPVAALFGVLPDAPIPVEAITAPGQIVALSSFDVAARVSGRTTFIADEGTSVAEGDVLLRMDDSAARATLASAEKSVADARAELARANGGTPIDAASIDRAYEQAATLVSNVHLNFAWIFATAESVLHGNELRESRANAYIYADLVRHYEPDIDEYRDAALDAYERTNNAYAKAAAAYRGMPHDATPEELEAALSQAQAILQANAATLKTVGDFLAVVRAEHENEDLPMPEPLSEHEGSIADALRTTNDNLESVANVREAIRSAKQGNNDEPDLATLQKAVSDAEGDAAAARAALERYTVTAPVSGVVTDVRVPEGSSVVDGQIFATVAADTIVARVAIAEPDLSKVKAGDSVTLSLDGAGFTTSGTILSIDSAATVENGAVTFGAIVGFDDPRVRTGMSATAHITK